MCESPTSPNWREPNSIATHFAAVHGAFQISDDRVAPACKTRRGGQRAMSSIRAATLGDLPRLTEIYKHYVMTTPITFDLEPFTPEQRVSWFEEHTAGRRHQLVVAEEDARVVGFACTGQFRVKRAYDTTVETTIYCAPGATGRGIGTLLYGALFAALANEDI